MNSNTTVSERINQEMISHLIHLSDQDHRGDWQVAGQKQQIDLKFSVPESDSDLRMCCAECS